MFSLENKVAVVTGAGSGIGATVAETLSRAGALVCCVARNIEQVMNVARRCDPQLARSAYLSCDVSDEPSVEHLSEAVVTRWHRVDILVTCAAAPASTGPTGDLRFEDWRSLLAVDLDGVFLTNRAFGPRMCSQGSGRIINLSSFHTVATYPARAAYNAAKSGVEGLSRALAVEWGSYGVTVNTVAPGPIRTPRTAWFLSRDPQTETGMIGRTPTARIGETEDVATTVTFLASDEARHINGQQIVIDGGWTRNAWWGAHERHYD